MTAPTPEQMRQFARGLLSLHGLTPQDRRYIGYIIEKQEGKR
ncbi:hypothetical protein [Curtobacterium sp. UCD-KPL2560]|nr:hypothetical protein [Curtobacterium sp. UCD-KPL2560]